MKGELRAGGLALVYGLRTRPEFNGKSVTLIGIAKMRNSDLIAAMRGEDLQVWWRVDGLLTGEICQINRRNLLPIDGDDHQEPGQLTKDKPAELTA